jgi:hypothetical protein
VSKQRAQGVLALILGLYLLLSLAGIFVSPAFEAPDEWYHYRFIRDLIEDRQLPVQVLGQPKTESHQPPLYYAVGAVLTCWISDDAGLPEVNPYWGYRAERVGVDNKRQYLHTEDEEGPCRGRCLAVRILRVYSVVLGGLSVLLGWLALDEVFENRAYVIGATALLAFNPMFLYISSAISNDNLIVPLTMLALWLALRAVRRGIRLLEVTMAGLITGLALLAKVSGLLLLPLFALAYGLAAWHRREWRRAAMGLALVVGLAVLLSGWWFARNLVLYHELTGIRLMGKIWAERTNPDIMAAFQELPYLWTTYWGRFGYGQIPLSDAIYNGAAGVVAMAVIGLARLWVRPPRWFDKETKLCVLVLLAVFGFFLVSTLNYMRISPVAAMGRFLFPVQAAIGGLLFLGLAQWLPNRWVPMLAVGVVICSVVLALVALVGYIAPAYARPTLLSPQKVAERARPIDVRFGDGPDGSIRLLGYGLARDRLSPGEEATVTLCWESLASMEEDYAYFVHILGENESKIGARDTHPGLSRYTTSQWTPGDVFCDDVHVPIGTWAPAPAVYDVAIGWYLTEADSIVAWLPAYDPNGGLLELVTVGKVKVAPEQYAAIQVPNRVEANLDGQVVLLGYQVDKLEAAPGEEINVVLYWEAQTPLLADYTVFLHLAASEGPPHAQADSPPQHGAYPTSFWDSGEVVIDPRTISVPADLPPGQYPLVAGMYLLETGERLRWIAPDGSSRGDAVPLPTLEIHSAAP